MRRVGIVGVGRALALAFADQSASVAVAARSADQVERVAEEVRSRGAAALALTADVGCSEDVQSMVRETRSRLGPLDILVNNAGSFPAGPVADMEEAEWDASMRVDLKAFYLCSRAALREGGMLERQQGHIINMASVSVRREIPNLAVHCSFKAGVLAFSESLRREVADRGIRVSIVCPSTIDTDLVRSEQARRYVHRSEKWLQPEDVVETVLFVATRRPGTSISEIAIVGV